MKNTKKLPDVIPHPAPWWDYVAQPGGEDMNHGRETTALTTGPRSLVVTECNFVPYKTKSARSVTIKTICRKMFLLYKLFRRLAVTLNDIFIQSSYQSSGKCMHPWDSRPGKPAWYSLSSAMRLAYPGSTAARYSPSSIMRLAYPGSTAARYSPSSVSRFAYPGSTAARYSPSSVSRFAYPGSTAARYSPSSVSRFAYPGSTAARYSPSFIMRLAYPGSTAARYSPSSVSRFAYSGSTADWCSPSRRGSRVICLNPVGSLTSWTGYYTRGCYIKPEVVLLSSQLFCALPLSL
ncbi:hypothetical protein J6590_086066 [Homalodisca vitripennis]|nr:hypothetical protein J6590_086066 [Homalodisca vitripennis]